MEVKVDPLTSNPTAAWEKISKSQKQLRIHAKPPSKPVEPNKVRVVCMSDTHTLTSHLRHEVPDGDIFIHAGDFTLCGSPKEVEDFNQWIGRLPHKHKIVIAGNHELSFDRHLSHPLSPHGSPATVSVDSLVDQMDALGLSRNKMRLAVACPNAKDLLTDLTYLEDEGVEIYGLKIYGTPWQPEYRKWAFNLPRGQACLSKWDAIPDDTDILITHTPPLGHGDLCCTGERTGCVELLATVQQRVKPRYHVFGHIHEAYGITSDGKTIFINASTCDISYKPTNPPIVFDIPVPAGFTKS